MSSVELLGPAERKHFPKTARSCTSCTGATTCASTAEVMQQLLHLQMSPWQPAVLGVWEVVFIFFFFGGLDSSKIFPFALLVEHRNYFIRHRSHVSLTGLSGERVVSSFLFLGVFCWQACHPISNLPLKQQLHSVCQLVGGRMKAISQAPIWPWDELLVVSFFFPGHVVKATPAQALLMVWNLLGKSAGANSREGREELKTLTAVVGTFSVL